MAQPNDCETCQQCEWDIVCCCTLRYCESCFHSNHLKRYPTHHMQLAADPKSRKFWKWVRGELTDMADAMIPAHFKKDEAIKWFGLHVQLAKRDHETGTASIVETDRLRDLMEVSLRFDHNSPKRQFPSITSFVGDTGAGKSLLIRSLLFHSEHRDHFKELETPVAGAHSGSSTRRSTTGEVNLYLDPTTFGTRSPVFYADSEGMLGSGPVAFQHQEKWMSSGRRYPVEAEKEKLMHGSSHRRHDVVPPLPSWAHTATQLLDWSNVGAQGSINHYSLPALIIILNRSSSEEKDWASDDHEKPTTEFFAAIAGEIESNNAIKKLAQKDKATSMEELFTRRFSSVHVHYVPLYEFGTLGTCEIIMQQTLRLAQRIRNDSARVQNERAVAWTRFDTRQLSLVIEDAFRHLAKRTGKPFDFSNFRRRVSIPNTSETQISEFLGQCLGDHVETRFENTAAVLGSAILRRNLCASEGGVLVIPDHVFNAHMRDTCAQAITDFLDRNLQCVFTDTGSGERCVNTKVGHSAGHQNSAGELLGAGLFEPAAFNADEFISIIHRSIEEALAYIDSNMKASADVREWRRLAAEQQRLRLVDLRLRRGYPDDEYRHPGGPGRPGGRKRDVRVTSVCYGCVFGRPEYALPCRHCLCVTCLEDFDQSYPGQRYPGAFVHKECIICAASASSGTASSTGKAPPGKDGWPHKAHIRPDLAGLRVLSLDGGGVRGIIELTILERLEKQIGLGLPIGRFFDFVIGTSAGGIIALGVGAQGRNIADCKSLYRRICKGFKTKLGTKTPGISWMSRWIQGAIYRSDAMEHALRSAFEGAGPSLFYGISNQTRVAITTTVDVNSHLITNYNLGGSGQYLNSRLALWRAARCTSAAPLYFEPMRHTGLDCRDGGLKDNNPVQLGVNECKRIWHADVSFDVVLSVGSGLAQKPEPRETTWQLIPAWLSGFFDTFMSTMDGEDAWKRFIQNQGPRIRNRALRLNVEFTAKEAVPALDDFEKIDWMEETARTFTFPNEPEAEAKDRFAPIAGRCEMALLERLADRIRASMYFFHLVSVREHMDIHLVTGWIGCRIEPGEPTLDALLERTKRFQVNGKDYPLPTDIARKLGL